MWRALRKTLRRGRSAVPTTFLRMRSLRRSRPAILMAMASSSSPRLLLAALARLTGLLANLLALVANALAAVRLRRAEPADLGGRLADHFLVGALEDDQGALGLGRHRGGDPFGEGVDDRVR